MHKKIEKEFGSSPIYPQGSTKSSILFILQHASDGKIHSPKMSVQVLISNNQSVQYFLTVGPILKKTIAKSPSMIYPTTNLHVVEFIMTGQFVLYTPRILTH